MSNKQTCKIILLVLAATFAVGIATAQTPLSNMFAGNAGEEPLPPDQAFQLNVRATAEGFVADWNITRGYYLYRDKIKITAADKPISKQLPSGQIIRDAFFGETEVFRNFLQVPFAFNPVMEDDRLSITYQGCADLGVCYPPITKVLMVRDITAELPRSRPQQTQKAGMPAPLSEQAQIAEAVEQHTIFATILAFLGFGILLALTPCILPMIPILSGVIAGGGAKLGTARALTLSAAYVLAMSVSYAAAGVVIGMTGKNVQLWLQTPWVIGLFALVFVLLALAMFGLYELKMPSALQTRLSRVGTEKRGSVLGAVIMGAVSALIVGPCVTPALVGALLFIAQTGDAATGGIALFSLGIGMGIPLMLIGTSLGKWLPQPGPAWDISKVIFGILFLAVAVWMLDRIVAVVVTQYLGALLLIMSAVYFLQVKVKQEGWQVFWRGLGGVMMIYGVLLAVAAATGGGSFLKPLEHLMQDKDVHATLAFQPIKSSSEFEQRSQQAVQAQQPMMLDFYADWCVTCKEMEAFTFSRPQVQQALSGIVLLQADVTKNDVEDQALMQQFNIFGPPAILFFDYRGQEVPGSRLVGFVDADEFVRHIRRTFSRPQSRL